MEKKLSYSDIAYKILKEDLNALSLHYKIIAKRAFDAGMLEENDIIIAGNISSAINS